MEFEIKVVENDGHDILLRTYHKDRPAGRLELVKIDDNFDPTFEDCDNNSWYVAIVYTEPDYRCLGVFKQLMTAAEELLKTIGCTMIILRPDDGSETPFDILISMYEKLGYEWYWEADGTYMYTYVTRPF